ncbi:MAG: type II toxin-antitoxin system RelE/ParE family toxin, partial [Candidatus Woesebacteria bacterium]|nr:type II toxin-antitoxin system RelE/ParE family toxin [Candidatus Woesebacteria bacterium]
MPKLSDTVDFQCYRVAILFDCDQDILRQAHRRDLRGLSGQATAEGNSGSSAAQAEAAQRKLKQIDAAGSIESLRVPPGNRLELLKRNRAGQSSICINDQWR